MSTSSIPPLSPTSAVRDFFAKNPLPPLSANIHSSPLSSAPAPLSPTITATANAFQNTFPHSPIASHDPHFTSSSHFLAPYRAADPRLPPNDLCIVGTFFPQFFVLAQEVFTPICTCNTSASNVSPLCKQEEQIIRSILAPRYQLCKKLITGFSNDNIPLLEKNILTPTFKKLVAACLVTDQPQLIADPVLEWIKDPPNLKNIQGTMEQRRNQLRLDFRLKLISLGFTGCFDEFAKTNKTSYPSLIKTVAEALQTHPLLNNLSQEKKDALTQYLSFIIPPSIRDFFEERSLLPFSAATDHSSAFSAKVASSTAPIIGPQAPALPPHFASYAPSSSVSVYALPSLPLKRTADAALLSDNPSNSKKAHTDNAINGSPKHVVL